MKKPVLTKSGAVVTGSPNGRIGRKERWHNNFNLDNNDGNNEIIVRTNEIQIIYDKREY
jgi:hypothetical protein